jgi:hypothetical protein
LFPATYLEDDQQLFKWFFSGTTDTIERQAYEVTAIAQRQLLCQKKNWWWRAREIPARGARGLAFKAYLLEFTSSVSISAPRLLPLLFWLLGNNSSITKSTNDNIEEEEEEEAACGIAEVDVTSN